MKTIIVIFAFVFCTYARLYPYREFCFCDYSESPKTCASLYYGMQGNKMLSLYEMVWNQNEKEYKIFLQWKEVKL